MGTAVTTPRKIGRPPTPLEDQRTAHVVAKVTPAEKAEIAAAAERAGLTVSDWMRRACMNAARDESEGERRGA